MIEILSSGDVPWGPHEGTQPEALRIPVYPRSGPPLLSSLLTANLLPVVAQVICANSMSDCRP